MKQTFRRLAVVTGAASGIGTATVARLLLDGFHVVAFDNNERALEALRHQVADPSSLSSVAGDVLCARSLQALEKELAQLATRLDVLVCCAGVLRVGPLANMPEGEWDLLFGVNVKGVFLTLQVLTPLMVRANDAAPRAAVIVMTSAAAVRPKVGGGAYAATKAAVTQLVKVWSVELAEQGVNINAVAPGTVDTPMSAALSTGKGNFALSGKAPIGRVAQPCDIADAISLLYDERARFITGAVLAVDGGLTAAFVPPPPATPSASTST